MASELALDAAVRACGPLAAFPAAWADFGSAGALEVLTALIASHENADIAAGALDVLRALTDEDAGGGGEEEEDEETLAAARAGLVSALRAAAAPPAIARRLTALDEGVPEEAVAVSDGLAVLQVMVEVDARSAGDVASPASTSTSSSPSPFLPWLLARVRLGTPGKAGSRPYDDVAGAASELLVVLAQAPALESGGGDTAAGPSPSSPPPAAAALLAAGGVDALLQALASYRTRDPADGEEGEHLENLGDALCALLLAGGGSGGGKGHAGSPAQAAFVEAEGVELATLLLRKKGAAAPVALKTLDFALSGCPAAAERLVAGGGLGPVFAAFMGKAKAALGAPPGGGGTAASTPLSKREAAAAEARAIGVVCHLLQTLPPDSSSRSRLAAKFTEAGGAKCERAVDLFARWWDGRVGGRAAALAARAADAGVPLDPALLARARLDAGLFTAHQLALIIGHAWGLESGESGTGAGFEARRAIVAALHDRGGSLARVRAALREYRDELGDGSGDTAAAGRADAEREAVGGMLAAMGEGVVVEVTARAPAPVAVPEPAPPPPPAAAPAPPPPAAREEATKEEAPHRRREDEPPRHRSRSRSRSPGRHRRRRSRSRSPRRDSGARRRTRSRSGSPRRRRDSRDDDGACARRRRDASRSRSPRRRRS